MAAQLWVGTTSTAWGTSGNWASTSAPATSGDSAQFDFNAVGGVAGSDQSATTLTALTIASTFQAFNFGDLATPLKVKAATAFIGGASGGQKGTFTKRINWDASTVATTIVVYGTASAAASADAGLEPVRIKGVNSSNAISIYQGVVGIATNALGDVATFGTISVLGTQAQVNVASGVTLTTLEMQTGGTANMYCGAASVLNDAGTLSTYGSGAITTKLNVSGIANLNSSGTITLLNGLNGGSINLLGDARPKTVTNCNLYKGSKLSFDPNVVTFTNPIALVGCNLEDVTIITPDNMTITIART